MPSAIRFTNALITYKTHLNKTQIETWFRNKFPVKDFHIAHETGESEIGYDHSHVVVKFARQYQTSDSSLRDFDYLDIHPNIKILSGNKAYLDAVKYISKEDTEVSLTLCEKVWLCETLEDALKQFVQKPSDTPGIIALYNAKPQPPTWNAIELRNWQTEFYEILKNSNSERHVHWIHSSGNSGKTYFMKYMLQQHPNDTVLVVDAAMSKDISLIFKNAIDASNTCKYVLFDCSRAFNFPDQFYATLERVKDGLMTSTKYNSCTLAFSNKVLVVMSNQWPNISKLTYDRWKLYNIDEQNLVSVDTSSIENIPSISQSY